MPDQRSTNRLNALRTIGAVARTSLKGVIKEAVLEALEEHESESTEAETTTESRSRGTPGAFVLVMFGVGVGYLLWRRRQSRDDEVLESVEAPPTESPGKPTTGVTASEDDDVAESESESEAGAEADD